MKEVTVVIPNYNGMKYLPECMASLCQGQENAPEYEVLIIDNGSADGSVEYLDSNTIDNMTNDFADSNLKLKNKIPVYKNSKALCARNQL